MTFLGNMVNRLRESLNFGDVPASEATLTFDQLPGFLHADV